MTPSSEEADEMSLLLVPEISEQTNDPMMMTNATMSPNATMPTTTMEPPTTAAAPVKKMLYAGNRGAYLEMFNNSGWGRSVSNGKLKVRRISADY